MRHTRAGLALLLCAAAAWAVPTAAATLATTPTTPRAAHETLHIEGDAAHADFTLPVPAVEQRTGEKNSTRLTVGEDTVVAVIAPSHEDVDGAATRLARATSLEGQHLTLTGETTTDHGGIKHFGCELRVDADGTAGPCTLLGTPDAVVLVGVLQRDNPAESERPTNGEAQRTPADARALVADIAETVRITPTAEPATVNQSPGDQPTVGAAQAEPGSTSHTLARMAEGAN